MTTPERLQNLSDITLADSNACIVMAGGPDSLAYENWFITSERWKERLARTESRIALLCYKYKVKLDATFSWTAILAEGETFLEAVEQFRQQHDTLKVIGFLCHGIGGFILKKALCTANAQSQRYASLLSSVVGIAFLDVPHGSEAPGPLKDSMLSLVRTVPNSLSKQSVIRLEKECHLMHSISKLFEDISFRVSTFSVYGTASTKLYFGKNVIKNLFKPTKSQQLVTSELAKTNCPLPETLIEVCHDHSGLVDLGEPGSEAVRELEGWLDFIYSEASRVDVERKVKHLQQPPSPSATITSLASHDAARQALAGEMERFVGQARSADNDPTAGTTGMQDWEAVPMIQGVTSGQRYPKLPCFMMETVTRDPDFCSRGTILEQLDDALLPPTTLTFSSEPQQKRHAVLWGTPGLGKTTIAAEFAFSRRNKFDAVLWIRADEPSKLEQDFAQIAVHLGLEDASEKRDPLVSREVARGWLESPKKILQDSADEVGQTEASWLLIFDNADRPDLLLDYWLLSSNGSVLVTSRDPLAKVKPSIASLDISIPFLEEQEAAEMLCKISRVNEDRESAVKIVQELGGLPLAVSQMAAIIQYQYLSFAEFLERYQDDEDRKRLQSYVAGNTKSEARGAVTTTWFVDKLPSSPRALLDLCAVLDPDNLQERLFTSNASSCFELDAFPRDNFEFSRARAELISRSLVIRNADKREFRVHRLLQDSVRMGMSKTRLGTVFAVGLKVLRAVWGATDLVRRHDIALSQSREGLFAHVVALKNVYGKEHHLQTRNNALPLAFLLNETAWWQHERGNSHEVRSFLTLAQLICEEHPGEECTQLLCDIHYGLAAVANETNDRKGCLEHTTIMLDMRVRMFEKSGQKDLRLAIAYNEHAIALVLHDRFEEAIEHFQISIDIYKSLEGYWPGMDTNPRSNMGFTLWWLGRMSEAKVMLEDLLRDREAKFGISDTESYRTGRVYHGLGNIAFSENLFNESEAYHRKAVAQWQMTIGTNHHKIADGYIRVARHCMRRNDLTSASTFLDQALRIFQRRPEVYKPEVARTLFTQAQLTMLGGDEATATALFKQAKDLRREIPYATPKPDSMLRERDFDDLILMWGR